MYGMLIRTHVVGGIPLLNLPACVEDPETLVSPTPEPVKVGFVVAFDVNVNVEFCVPPPDGVNVTVTT